MPVLCTRDTGKGCLVKCVCDGSFFLVVTEFAEEIKVSANDSLWWFLQRSKIQFVQFLEFFIIERQTRFPSYVMNADRRLSPEYISINESANELE